MNAAAFRKLIKDAAAQALEPRPDGSHNNPDLQLCAFIGALEGGLSYSEPELAKCLASVGHRPAKRAA